MDEQLPKKFRRKLIEAPWEHNGTPCWIWLGYTEQDGYGRIAMPVGEGGEYRKRQAHRVIYEILVGAVPSELQLDHLCRVRCCCNPAHLEPVTPGENIRRSDLSKRGQHWRDKTHCPKGHEYTEENTYRNHNGRWCKACAKEKNREAYRKAHPLYWMPRKLKTHCPQGHEYTEENTRVYKGARYCRACAKEKNAARYTRPPTGN